MLRTCGPLSGNLVNLAWLCHFQTFCLKSDIYTHFWTFLGDFALKMLCGGKAP
jgi:hypothetical protein